MKSAATSIELRRFEKPLHKELRDEIIDILFRGFPFEDLSGREILIDETDSYKIFYSVGDKYLDLTLENVHDIAEEALHHVFYFMDYLKNYFVFQWFPQLDILYRRSRILLHKFHRIAPVFDYPRARVNLKILQELLSKIGFWPQICTQIALVLYITDKNTERKEYEKPLLQKNIRTLCNCSAYAFHRARNIIKQKTNLSF